MSDDSGIRLDCLTCATTVVLGSGTPTAAARAFFTGHPSCVTVIDATEQLVGWSHAGRTSLASGSRLTQAEDDRAPGPPG